MKYDFAAIEKKNGRTSGSRKALRRRDRRSETEILRAHRVPVPFRRRIARRPSAPFTAMDIICRKKRMQGYNVLNPIGFDAFGLPTENYAIKNHIHPAVVTKNNIAHFTKQLKMLGYGFDWDREVDTTDPSYYKWTQWIFLQNVQMTWPTRPPCPSTGARAASACLRTRKSSTACASAAAARSSAARRASGCCAITKYADRLIDDLDDVDFIPA